MTEMGVDRRQHRAGDHYPEGIQRLEADRVDGKAKDLMMDVVDGEEVQRGRHLGIQNVKQHRLDHQNKGDEHFVASSFIEAKRLTEKERNNHDRQNNQHQVGDHHVMHQPGAEKIITTVPASTSARLRRLRGDDPARSQYLSPSRGRRSRPAAR